ncbi:hypothetical protein [Nocardia brasiliensis]|uniref:hypothetical protein n=1 Tax=Nocardia brasiliensis TaxID=37326 RepID=UPI00189530C4|nr:hypothetical protein [Nocardia brasiliensis]MBF6130954.1 hypothetical protein [Nocardia brasiliensis]
MATVGVLRIARLRALIDHPGTGAGERAVAQRMLDRILGKSGTSAGTGSPQRSYGARHGRGGRHADLPRIVEMIRADIDFAQRFTVPGEATELELRSPIRDAPAGITYSVESPSYGRIVIGIEGVPLEWGWSRVDGIETVAAALHELATALADVMDSYNRDGPEVGKRFFGSVRVHDVTLVW